MSCIITRKSRASIRGKLHHCQTYMRHFSHRRKKTAFSSRDSFPYNESRHDSYPQFPRSSLRTRGLQTRSHRKKKRLHFKSPALLKQARLTSLFIFEVLQYGKCVFIFHTDVFIDVSLMSQIAFDSGRLLEITAWRGITADYTNLVEIERSISPMPHRFRLSHFN